MKLKTTFLLPFLATAWITLSCNNDDHTTPLDLTTERLYPKKLILIYEISGFGQQKDTLTFDYQYTNGRITTITRYARMWDTGGKAGGPLHFAESNTEIMEFSYLERQILVDVTLNGNPSGSFTFEFNNEDFKSPSTFKLHDANGLLMAEAELNYDDDGFLKKRIANWNLSDDLLVETGNILLITQNQQPITEYTATISPINQFTGFSFFTYKPFASWGIDPIGIVFKWFRSSKDLVASINYFGIGTYSYGYSGDQLTSISFTYNSQEYVKWRASIEY